MSAFVNSAFINTVQISVDPGLQEPGPKVTQARSTVSSDLIRSRSGLPTTRELNQMTNGPMLMSWRKRWNRNLMRFLGSRARATDVEDLAQETYLRLLRAPDLENVRNPEAYLISVANHVLAEWRQQQVDALPIEGEFAVEPLNLEVEAEARISQRRIDEALSMVSPVMRAVLLLRLRDDRSCKDIARDLGLSERQVKRQLAQGYDLLRRALEVEQMR